MTKILGFDPGEKYTGWALIRGGRLVGAGELERWDGIDQLIQAAFPAVVVAEDFRLYPARARAQGGNQLWTARVLGVVQFICERYEIQFELQPASRIRNDPMVKDLKTEKSKHADDAYKHAMAYHFANYTEVYSAKSKNKKK